MTFNNSHIVQYKKEIRSKSIPLKHALQITLLTLQLKSPLLLGRRSIPLRKNCAGANIMYSEAFISHTRSVIESSTDVPETETILSIPLPR
jgi:hypothetical protein